MPHPHVSPAEGPARPVVSRRRLLESGAAVLGALALAAPSGAALAAGPRPQADDGPPEWNDFGVFRLGTEPPHTTLMPYADVPQALAADRTRSPYRLDLDGTWKFAYADRPEDRDPDFHRTDTDDRGWDTIPVPSVWQLHGHDFPIYLNITYPYWGPNGRGEEPQPPAAPTRYNPVGQYRRTFTVPRDWHIGSAKRLRLNFQAVDWRAEVYVNGTKVTAHEGGYDKFSVDVTDALKRSGPQELIVGVYDPTDAADGENPPMGKQRLDPSGIWYTPSSGIWQTVWMEPVARDHVDSLRLIPDVQGERLTVEATGVRAGLPVTATAYDGRRKVATATGRTGQPLTLKIRKPHLWSPDDPFLYDLKVRVGADRVNSYFGMRSIAVEKIDGVPRTVLNGKPVFLMATLDQGFWPDGLHTAPTDEALAYDLKAHKQLGFNSVRKHIKVEPDRWFYWADRLGLLVWQDMPSMRDARTPDAEARARYEREMKEMIDEHISSPSIVMWVTFNEGWGQYDVGRIAAQAKSWDPGRLVNNQSGLNLGADGGAGDIMDEHGYPSPALPPRPDGERALVSGEYGGLGLAVPGHAWPVQQSYVDVDPATYTDDYLTKLDEVRALVCRGGNGAVYTQISDVEGELNGLLTYDRRVMKPDVERVRAAQRDLIRDASRARPAGCPATD